MRRNADGRGWKRGGGAGFLPEEQRGRGEVVWARGRVATEECPKSLVTPASLEWIEKFLTWKFAGGGALEDCRRARRTRS